MGPRGTEQVPLLQALGRVLAIDVTAPHDLPPFDRSLVDGWAVRAADARAAAPGAPVTLRPAGEVRMGAAAGAVVGPGDTVRIPTGGMLPQGADAVVMQEHARVGLGAVAVESGVKPGDNVVAAGADVRLGQTVFARGRRLRAADLGILAGIGHARVEVTLRPRVAILSTGDEVLAAEDPIAPGKVRDMNGAALAAAVIVAGGEPVVLGVVRDELAAVEAALRRAVEAHEMVLVSGGSSVGERDVVVDAIARLGPPGITVHGISVRPGKPTVLAAAGAVPVIGLPGNPVSALVIFDLFARPVLERLLGMDAASRGWDRVRARLASRLPSAGPREDHRRVKLETRADGVWAAPLPAGSQILTSLTEADGIVVVPADSDGFETGAAVDVRLL